ncbi:hypothetical protein [Halorhodospira abdelmalekii]
MVIGDLDEAECRAAAERIGPQAKAIALSMCAMSAALNRR